MKAGWGKTDITPNTKDVVMMGYSHNDNVFKSSATPIYCRALWLENQTNYLLIYLDINHITKNLHDYIVSEITKKYKIEPSEIHITASHTHSAPGGYGNKLYYEIPTPGFQSEVFETYTKQSLEAVNLAFENLSSAEISYGESSFDEKIDVAFNRSLASFYKNPEANGDESVVSAVNREMYQLNIKTEKGLAVANWFGCHTTSIPNSGTAIHFDNKGYACQMMEEHLGQDSIAIFAQGTTGDISPNYIYDKAIKQNRGPSKDMDENARLNGTYQFEKSKEINSIKENNLNLNIKTYKEEVDFSSLESENGEKRLGPASFGTSFIAGTMEGRGVPPLFISGANFAIILINSFIKVLGKSLLPTRLAQYNKLKEVHGNKHIFINATDKEILNIPLKGGVPLVSIVDPFVKKLNKLVKKDLYKNAISWYDEKLPVQLVDLGEIALVNLPFELTTMAGRRVTSLLSDKLSKKIVISCYSNSYAGYITTPEEYDCQAYEGGHTVFGRETLPVVMDKLESIVDNHFNQ